LNKEIEKVLVKLGEQADRERNYDVLVEPDDRMLAITSETGLFFNMLLHSISAKNILEIGTSTGYSTLWFADVIKNSGGKIITIEENPSKIKRAKKNFEDANVMQLIQILQGNAKNILYQISKEFQTKTLEPFDFIFIDADKENAIQYFDLAYPMIRVGGFIAADNILHPESCVSDMRRYSNYVQSRKNMKSVTIPIGNGEELSLKTG
jgi:predicted O-methyltransferase YrrM